MQRLIRLPEVMALTGRSRSRIYAAMEVGAFPKSVKIGDRAVAWVEREVQDWIAARAAERELA